MSGEVIVWAAVLPYLTLGVRQREGAQPIDPERDAIDGRWWLAALLAGIMIWCAGIWAVWHFLL